MVFLSGNSIQSVLLLAYRASCPLSGPYSVPPVSGPESGRRVVVSGGCWNQTRTAASVPQLPPITLKNAFGRRKTTKRKVNALTQENVSECIFVSFVLFFRSTGQAVSGTFYRLDASLSGS